MSGSASPFAAWFNDPEHADVLINVCVDDPERAGVIITDSSTGLEPRAKKAKTQSEAQESAAAAPPACSYNCHAIVLSAHSGYFKAQLSSTWLQAEAAAGPSSTARAKRQAKKTKRASAPAHAAGTKRTVSVHIEAEDLDAMQELLKMMYSQKLPPAAAPSEPLFLQCLILADQFQAASCMELLLTALAAVPCEDITYEMLWYVFQPSPGVEAAQSYPALLASATKALLQLFGDVPGIIRNQALLQEFFSLPHAAVLAWAKTDELRVDSENCVVFLLSAWVKANQDSTTAQHEELAHQIRVFNLGPAYLHHILPNLSWFKGCSGMQHLPAVWCCKSAGITMKDGGEKERTTSSGLDCPAAWIAKPRRSSNSFRITWVVGSSQLKELDSGTRLYLLPAAYVNGFLMRIYLQQAPADPSAAAPGKTLGLFRGCNSAGMEQWGLTMPRSMMLPIGALEVQVGSSGSRMIKKANFAAVGVVKCGTAMGRTNVLGSSSPTIRGLVAPYVHEGRLRVQATFSGVDLIM